MRYEHDENGELVKVAWTSLQDTIAKRGVNKGKKLWINTQEYIDEMVKKHYNDALAFSHKIRTPLLTDADKESFALEGLYEAAGMYDPTKGMKFTSYVFLCVKCRILREMNFLKNSGRSIQLPFSDVFMDDHEIEEDESADGIEKPREVQKYRYVTEVPNSATGYYQNDGTRRTIFDVFHLPEQTSAYDLEQLVLTLQERLNDKQRLILEHLLQDDVNGNDIAKKLGITRQAVNLHLHKIRRHTKAVLKQIAPEIKTGE